jgi:S1-C subfamily serine protease
VLGAVLILSNDSAPKHPSGVIPVRVTSGNQIATGFAVGRDRIVTVAHVLGEPVTVDGARARIVRADRRSDLALLEVPGLGTGSADATALAAISARVGSRLRLLRLRDGRASSLSVDVRRAIVAHVRAGRARAVTRPALELAARVAPGDSGAPLVSGSGALAGVIFAASRRRETTAYAVDARAVMRLIAPR